MTADVKQIKGYGKSYFSGFFEHCILVFLKKEQG